MITNKKSLRIAIGIAGPVTFFPLVLFLSSLAEGKIDSAFVMLFLMLIASLVFIGFQSAIYSLLMENIVNKHINNSSIAVLISAILGFLSGHLIDMIIGEGFFGKLGILVGFVYGIVLRVMYIRANPEKSFYIILPNIIINRANIYKYMLVFSVYIIAYLPIREFHILVHYRTYQDCNTPFSSEMDYCHTVTFPRMEILFINFPIAIPIRIIGLGVEILYFPLTLMEATHWQILEQN